MPKRHGNVLHQLLKTIADLQFGGLIVDERSQLSTAHRKAVREYVQMREHRKAVNGLQTRPVPIVDGELP